MNNNPYLLFDDYAFRHLPRHLAAAGDTEALFSLMNNEFCLALRKYSKTDLLFTSHLSFARTVAFEQGKQSLLHALRMMFMEVGLRSTADSISPSTLMLMVRVGDVDRALDMTELIRLNQVKGVAIVLVSRALEDSKDNISQDHIDRLLEIADVTLIGDIGVAVLIAISRLYTALALQMEANKVIDTALRLAVRQLPSPILEQNIASIANAYVYNNALENALNATDMDRVGVDIASVVADIAELSYAQGNLPLAKLAVERMEAIPEWVSGHQGLPALDVYRVANLAQELGEQELYKQLVEKGQKAAEDTIGVKGLAAQTLQAHHEGNLELFKERLNGIKQKAEEEWGASFKAKAWLEIANMAQKLGMDELQEQAVGYCAGYAAEDDLFRVYDTVLALVELYDGMGRLDEASRFLLRIVSSDSYKSYDKDNWLRIAILKAEKCPDHAQELLQLEGFLHRRDAPPHIMAEYGVALAGTAKLEAAQRILADLETRKPATDTDPALSLLFGNLFFETQHRPELRKAALDWWYQTRIKIGINLGSVQLPENCNYITQLDWIVGQLLINTPLSKPRTDSDFVDPALRRSLLDKEEGYLRQLTPQPEYQGDNPSLLMQEAVAHEASMGDAIGMVGESIATQLAQAAAGYIVRNDLEQAIEALRQIQYWRIQAYITVAPMDSEDFGAHEKLFNMGCTHAGALVSIAASIQDDTERPFSLFSRLFEETARLPHDSTRYAARKLIVRYLGVDDARLLELTRIVLQTAFDKGRDEFLSCLASWVTVLLNLGGTSVITRLATFIELVSTPVETPYLPRVQAYRHTGGQLRTFNIVRE